MKAQKARRPAACEGSPDDGPSAEEIDAYVAEQAASGKYPHLAELGQKKLSLGVKAEAFEAGLEWLLAGIAAEVGELPAARLSAQTGGRPPGSSKRSSRRMIASVCALTASFSSLSSSRRSSRP